MDEIFSRQFAMPQPKPQAGMFGGGKPDWTSAVQAAIGGWLAGGGAPGGQQILSQLHQRQMMAQQQAMEDQQYQRQRSDGMQDWIARQEYEQAHQGPDPLAQMMMQAGIDPNSPQGRQMYGQALQNKVNPFVQMRVQNPDGSESLQFTRPPSIPSAPVGGLTPIDDGGAGPSQAPQPFSFRF